MDSSQEVFSAHRVNDMFEIVKIGTGLAQWIAVRKSIQRIGLVTCFKLLKLELDLPNG